MTKHIMKHIGFFEIVEFTHLSQPGGSTKSFTFQFWKKHFYRDNIGHDINLPACSFAQQFIHFGKMRNTVCGEINPLQGVEIFLCRQDRKSTRLNSSHVKISYAVFCLKKK